MKRTATIVSICVLLCCLPFLPYYQRTTTFSGRTTGLLSEQVSYPGPSIGAFVLTVLGGLLVLVVMRSVRRLLMRPTHAPVAFDRVSWILPFIILFPLAFHRISVDTAIGGPDGRKDVVTHGFGEPSSSFTFYFLAAVLAVLIQFWIILRNVERLDA